MAIKDILQDDYQDILIVPIVVFSTKAELKVTTKHHVIYSVHLNRTIKTYNKEVISEKDKLNIYKRITDLNINNKDKRKQHVKTIKENIKNKNNIANNNICPRCGSNLVIRKGKNGNFMGCNQFPKCRYTKDI